ncbi:hypothetical protein NQ318_015804 [Aromia moschata]|uniref:Uncharacterized protein n=1 Tax=Aromia moschata TaxID=1265417 RepID=A0AAV8YRE5_9CUCU|nr:hypothetical protein NQ318_015804 [Aromia moschata]
MNVYPAHKFLNGLNGLRRDVKRPKTIHAPDGPQRQKRKKTQKIDKLTREDRRLSIRGLAEITGIDKECIRQILHESFKLCKVCAKMVPILLTPEQKESRMKICADVLNNMDTDPSLLGTVTLKRTRLESVEAVKAKATEVLNQLTEADIQHCFQQWKSRMERCRELQGEYIEGEKVATLNRGDQSPYAVSLHRLRVRAALMPPQDGCRHLSLSQAGSRLDVDKYTVGTPAPVAVEVPELFDHTVQRVIRENPAY